MPLTRVQIWENGAGWRRITAEEADMRFKHFVPANSKTFICERCYEYVLFVKTHGKHVSHFKHKKGNQYKECEDRIHCFNHNGYVRLMQSIVLPIRLIYDRRSICLELGFPPITKDEFEDAEMAHAMLVIKGNMGSSIKYAVNSSRFSTETIAYHPLGGDLSETYVVEVLPRRLSGRLAQWHGMKIGLHSNGTMFHAQSGKMIPINGDIEIGTDYLLLVNREYPPYHVRDIQIEHLTTYNGYALYKVRATELTKEATVFFFQYNICLKKTQTRITPLWPVLREGDHYAETDASVIGFLQEGDADMDVYPNYPPHSLTSQTIDKERQINFVVLNKQSAIQLVWVAHMSILRYLYLRAPSLMMARLLPDLTVETEEGTEQGQGVHTRLPVGKKLYIKDGKYDGHVERYRNRSILRKHTLNAGSIVIIEQLDFDEEICVYQGMDCVYRIAFVKETVILSNDERAILQSLRNCRGAYVPLPYRFGYLAGSLHQMPSVLLYLRKAIQSGVIRRDALPIIAKAAGG